MWKTSISGKGPRYTVLAFMSRILYEKIASRTWHSVKTAQCFQVYHISSLLKRYDLVLGELAPDLQGALGGVRISLRNLIFDLRLLKAPRHQHSERLYPFSLFVVFREYPCHIGVAWTGDKMTRSGALLKRVTVHSSLGVGNSGGIGEDRKSSHRNNVEDLHSDRGSTSIRKDRCELRFWQVDQFLAKSYFDQLSHQAAERNQKIHPRSVHHARLI
jgi:hypothetical protein